MTIPYVGKSIDAIGYEAVFGYLFGYTTDYTIYSSSTSEISYTYVNTKYGQPSNTIWQYTCNTYYYSSHSKYYCNSYFYYIPTTIKKVTITNQEVIPSAAFNNCDFINSIS
mgnify:CR=1 FL=1